MDYTKNAREFFKNDHYATGLTGIEIEKAEPEYAKCILKLTENHRNSNQQVMGGAIFTLADFTFAVAANVGQETTVTLSSQIEYLNTVKGNILTAETNCLKSGRKTCVIEVTITDELGTLVAKTMTTGLRV